MRATILGIEVEGTVAEISALIREHGAAASAPLSPNVDSEKDAPFEDERFASEKIAFRALNRRPLSAAQRILFRTLLDAYPNWTPASQLQAATEYSPNQLGGLLGATGRRLSQTLGYVADSSMIEWMWDSDDNEYHYRLPPSVLAAVKRIDP
jgi:hypothetical protein